MAVPQTKTELLSAIDKTFTKLIRYLHTIPPELTTDKSLPGHVKDSDMSVCNLVAYLLGWNMLVIKWLTHDAQGKAIDFPETGYRWNQLGQLAQKFYLDYSTPDYPALVSQLQSANAQIVALIHQRSDAELYSKTWYGKWTMGRMISLNTSSPYENSCGRLRKWASEQHLSVR